MDVTIAMALTRLGDEKGKKGDFHRIAIFLAFPPPFHRSPTDIKVRSPSCRAFSRWPLECTNFIYLDDDETRRCRIVPFSSHRKVKSEECHSTLPKATLSASIYRRGPTKDYYCWTAT